MELQRIGIKLFVEDPSTISLTGIIPVFHTWIQKQILKDHMLIDTHDYSHIHNGPGILLVAHQGNISIDMADGRPGLLYFRKQAIEGTFEGRLLSILKTTLQACSFLEDEPVFQGRLHFRTDEILIIANDRLVTSNDAQTLSRMELSLSAVFKKILGGAHPKLALADPDPKERFAVRVQTGRSIPVKTLLEKI